MEIFTTFSSCCCSVLCFSGGWLDKLPRRSSGNLISFQERREVSTSRWHLSAAGLNRHGRKSVCVSAVWRENVSNFPVSRHVVTHHEKRRYGLADCFYVLTRRVAFHLNSRRKIFYSFSISPRIEVIFMFTSHEMLLHCQVSFLAQRLKGGNFSKRLRTHARSFAASEKSFQSSLFVCVGAK